MRGSSLPVELALSRVGQSAPAKTFVGASVTRNNGSQCQNVSADVRLCQKQNKKTTMMMMK